MAANAAIVFPHGVTSYVPACIGLKGMCQLTTDHYWRNDKTGTTPGLPDFNRTFGACATTTKKGPLVWIQFKKSGKSRILRKDDLRGLKLFFLIY